MSEELPVKPSVSAAGPALDPVIRDRLQAFAARRRGLILTRGLFGALAAWLAAVICVAAADLLFLLEDGVRFTLSGATYVLALFVFWRIAGKPLRERADLGAAARWIEATDPKLREWVLAAVELGRVDPASVQDSAAFRSLVQQDVARELSGRDVRQLLPTGLVMRWARIAGVAVVLVALLFCVPGLPTWRLLARAALPGSNLDRISRTHLDVVEPAPADPTVPRGGIVAVVVQVGGKRVDEIVLERFGGEGGRARVRMKPIGEGRYTAAVDADLPRVQYRVRGGDAMTRKFTVTTVPAPHVVAFTKTYRYPAYTGLGTTNIVEAGGVIEGVEGTEVDLTIEADQPLNEASMRLDIADRKSTVELKDRGANKVGTTLRLERPGTYHVRLVARETSFENTQSPVYEIRVAPDLVPAVELETPTVDRSVAPDDVVALAGVAKDDFGVAKLRQEYQINKQGWRLAMEWPSTQKESRASTSWDLLQLGLKPGDEVLVRYAAVDSRGSRGESTTRRLVVGTSGFSAAKREAVEARQRLLAALEKTADAGGALRKTVEANREKLKGGREEPNIKEAQAQVAAAVRDLDRAAAEAEEAVRQALQKTPEGTAAREMAAVGRSMSRIRRNDLTMAQQRLDALDEQNRQDADRMANELMHHLNRAQWEPKRIEQTVEKMVAADEAALAARDLEEMAAEMERVQKAARSDDPAQRATAERRQTASATHAKAVADMLEEMADHSNRKGELQRFARELREAATRTQEALDPQQTADKKRDPAAAADELRNRTARFRDELKPMAAQARREADEARRNLENDLEKRPFQQLASAIEPMAWKRDMTPAQREFQAGLAEAARKSVADQLRDRAALEELRRDAAPGAVKELSDEAAAVEQIRPDASDPKSAEAELKQLRKLAEAHEKLEAGRELAQAARQARTLAEDERWDAGQTARAVERGREWPALRSDLDDIERDLRESKLPEAAVRAVADAKNSNEARETNDEMTKRNERREVGRNLDPQLSNVAGRLDEAKRAAEPGLQEARQEVAALAPTLAERLAAARDQAREQREQTQQLAAKPDAEDRRAGVLDSLRDQHALNRELDAVRADLRHDAAAQDMASEKGRDRARDADDGLAMLREPPPKAEQLLEQAAAAEAADQKQLLTQAQVQQTRLENALGMLADHYQRLEEGKEDGLRAALRQQEGQMALTPGLDEAYEKAENLAQLQAQSPEQSAAALERELASNPAMQRALDRLSREALNRAQTGLDQAAAGEQQLARQTAQLAKNREEKARALQERAGELARRAGELNRDRVQPTAQKAGQINSQAAQNLKEGGAKLQQAAGQAPTQAAANPEAAAQQMKAMAEGLQQAAEQLNTAAQTSDREAQAGGSPEQQNERRNVAGQARDESGKAAELAREANGLAQDLAQMQPQEVGGLRNNAQQQPPLTAQVGDAARELDVAAHHQELLGRNAGEQLGQVADRAAANAQNELPAAGQSLQQSPAASTALPAVQQAGEQTAARAAELQALAAQLPPLGQGETAAEAAPADPSAALLAQALDQLARAAAAAPANQGQPAQQASALSRAAQAQQHAMTLARAQGQVPGSEAQGAPMQVAGRSGPALDPVALARAPADWGKLRDQAAQDVREVGSEKVPEEYRAMVESYFKAVAGDAQKGTR